MLPDAELRGTEGLSRQKVRDPVNQHPIEEWVVVYLPLTRCVATRPVSVVL